jgi:hypothetical protein
MKEVDASWKRAVEVVDLLAACNRELSSHLDKLIKDKINMNNYIGEITDIIDIQKDRTLQATDMDCTVDDIECNTDELEGFLDNAFEQVENLKNNLNRLKKGE